MADTSGGPDACWPWLGYVNPRGYGRAGTEPAHRRAWREVNGPIPLGMQVDHMCHNMSSCTLGEARPHRRCVNPRHLALATPKENSSRGRTGAATAERQRAKTRCPSGHAYNDRNTRRDARGYRKCRICDRDRQRSKRKAAAHA